MRVPLALQSYRDESLPVSAQDVINMMAEKHPEDAKARVTLMPTPGLDLFASLPAGPIRGMAQLKERLLVVAGPVVCTVSVTGAFVALGVIDNGGPVRMAASIDEMVIVVPETRRAWIATNSTLTEITSEDFEGAVDVVHLDGFHIFVKPDSATAFGSALNDASTYDGLAFVTAEGSSDNLLAVRRLGTSLVMMGERSVELFSNVGGENPLPFERIPGAYLDRGTAAPQSCAVIAETMFYLGQNRQVYALNNLTPTPIAGPAIVKAFDSYTTVNDAIGWCYEQRSHTFYVLTFPSAGETWVYDTTTQVWHKRESEPTRYRGIWRCWVGGAFGGAVIAGDAVDGRLYRLNPARYDEAGDTIIRTAVGMPMHREGKRLTFWHLHLECEMGIGIPSGQGSQPECWLSHSDDGGQTFSNQQSRNLGPIGQRLKRAEWHRLGMSRDRVFKVEYSDPVPLVITAVNVEADAEQ